MSQSTTTPTSPGTPRRAPPTWVKTLAWTAAAVVMLWPVGSCAASTTSAPSAAETQDPSLATFGQALDNLGIPKAQHPRMAEAGRSACDALDAGATPQQVALVAFDSGRRGLTAYQAGVIVRASVIAFCPRHQPALDGG